MRTDDDDADGTSLRRMATDLIWRCKSQNYYRIELGFALVLGRLCIVSCSAINSDGGAINWWRSAASYAVAAANVAAAAAAAGAEVSRLESSSISRNTTGQLSLQTTAASN